MFTFDDFIFALKIALVLALTDTIFPYVYEVLRGFHLKNHLMRHSNLGFRFIVAFTRTLIVFIPLLSGVSIYLVFPMALFVTLGLQVIADDCI